MMMFDGRKHIAIRLIAFIILFVLSGTMTACGYNFEVDDQNSSKPAHEDGQQHESLNDDGLEKPAAVECNDDEENVSFGKSEICVKNCPEDSGVSGKCYHVVHIVPGTGWAEQPLDQVVLSRLNSDSFSKIDMTFALPVCYGVTDEIERIEKLNCADVMEKKNDLMAFSPFANAEKIIRYDFELKIHDSEFSERMKYNLLFEMEMKFENFVSKHSINPESCKLLNKGNNNCHCEFLEYFKKNVDKLENVTVFVEPGIKMNDQVLFNKPNQSDQSNKSTFTTIYSMKPGDIDPDNQSFGLSFKGDEELSKAIESLGDCRYNLNELVFQIKSIDVYLPVSDITAKRQ